MLFHFTALLTYSRIHKTNMTKFTWSSKHAQIYIYSAVTANQSIKLMPRKLANLEIFYLLHPSWFQADRYWLSVSDKNHLGLPHQKTNPIVNLPILPRIGFTWNCISIDVSKLSVDIRLHFVFQTSFYYRANTISENSVKLLRRECLCAFLIFSYTGLLTYSYLKDRGNRGPLEWSGPY